MPWQPQPADGGRTICRGINLHTNPRRWHIGLNQHPRLGSAQAVELNGIMGSLAVAGDQVIARPNRILQSIREPSPATALLRLFGAGVLEELFVTGRNVRSQAAEIP